VTPKLAKGENAMRDDIKEIGICSICGNEYDDFGNNAWPVNDGRCCFDCCGMHVFPKRLRMLAEADAEREADLVS
jgi:hypothetical protein